MSGRSSILLMILAAGVLAPQIVRGVERLKFRPGFNLFKPTQDVELGKEASGQAEKQMPLLNDPQTVQYISNLGHRLATFAPNNNSDYAWQFKVVNSSEINAFALPGGYIYVNRGAIEAAEEEAEIAGVMAHESGHVVMRHGTNQASKALLAQLPLAVLGSFADQSGGLVSQVFSELGGFAAGSWMLHNSRDAEKQADEVGTYILYQAGYDPHAMAQFFEIIQKKYPQRTLQFFSDHPNPENRIKDVDAEIPELGPARDWKTDSPEFEAVKKHLLSLPPPPKAKPAARAEAGPSGPPPAPSNRMVKYDGTSFAITYPDNWQVQKSEDAVAIYPPGGIITDSQGGGQAYGVSISRFRPQNSGGTNWGLVDATQELLKSMQQSNPNMRVAKQGGMKLHGHSAVTTLVENDSPISGQKEQDQVVTLRQNDSLLALIFIAPEKSFETYKPTFDSMLQSLEIQ